MYSIDDLRTFVAIAEASGVTAGARRVGISAATASHRLNKLEAALELTLFHRNSRMMRLTDEGRIFFERTEAILADLAQAERDAGSRLAQLKGQLRVTMSPWILSRYILPKLPEFQREHPELTFDFLAVDRFVSLSAEGQDCAIRVGKMSDSALVARKLGDNQRIICASPEFLAQYEEPKDAQTALELPWVSLPWQTRIAFKDAKGKRRDASIRANVHVSNSDTLTDAVTQGLGLAIKSRSAIQSELDQGRLWKLPKAHSGSPMRQFGLFFHPKRGQLPRLTCSESSFRNALHKLLQSGHWMVRHNAAMELVEAGTLAPARYRGFQRYVPQTYQPLEVANRTSDF